MIAKKNEASQIICGDVNEVLQRLPASSVQCIIADPPYFKVQKGQAWDNQWKTPETYTTWMQEWVENAMRTLKDDGICFIFGQVGKLQHVWLHVMSRLTHQHAFHDLIIWDRVVGYEDRRDSFSPQYEMVLVLRKHAKTVVKFNKDAVREPYTPEKIAMYMKDKRYKDMDARRKHLERGKFITNIMRIPSLKGASNEKCGHPTQKPEALICNLIASSTDVGDWVLDPFLGSGTTAAVAEVMERRWIGIERDPEYVEMAKARLAKLKETP